MFRLFFFVSLAVTSALASYAHADGYYSFQSKFVCADLKKPFHVQAEIGTIYDGAVDVVTITERSPDGTLVSSTHQSKREPSPWDTTRFFDSTFRLELALAPDPTIQNFHATLILKDNFDIRWQGKLNCRRVKN